MPRVFDFLLDLMAEFAGGPGPPGNNLVRFGLAATLWFALLVIAYHRQGQESPPRERLLALGFALILLREIFKFGHLSVRLLTGTDHDIFCSLIAPMEHALTLTAVVVIAGAFLRYILDDARVAGSYLRIGLGISAIATMVTFIWWPFELAANPGIQFHATLPASILHLLAALLIGAAILLLARRRGWLRNTLLVAFAFLFVSELLTFLNFATAHANNEVLCPLANSFYLWAIPIFAYVYYREQANEKRAADIALQSYRNHLEELVDARTVELTHANRQLAMETKERIRTLEHAAALEERHRIAAEMHDGLAQILSYLGLKTDEATSLLQRGQVQAADGTVHQIRSAIGQATYEVRRSIAVLQENPPAPISLQSAIEQVVHNAQADSPPSVAFVNLLADPVMVAYPELEQVTRVVQEALSNARKHAHATQLCVTLAKQCEQAGDTYFVTIADDGCGFDLAHTGAERDDHFGISIMRARAERLGGRLSINTCPQGGTRVELAWPANRSVPPRMLKGNDQQPECTLLLRQS